MFAWQYAWQVIMFAWQFVLGWLLPCPCYEKEKHTLSTNSVQHFSASINFTLSILSFLIHYLYCPFRMFYFLAFFLNWFGLFACAFCVVFFSASNTLSFMSISYDLRSKCLANWLLSSLIDFLKLFYLFWVFHASFTGGLSLESERQQGARGVIVIVIWNGHGDTSSNPGRV